MLSKVISVVLTAVLLQGSVAAQTPPQQSVSKMQEVLRKAQEKDKAVKITLARKIDNQAKLSGKVSEVSDTGFALTDEKTGKITKLAYQDVQEVKQKGSRGWKIALVVIAAVVVAAVIVGETISE